AEHAAVVACAVQQRRAHVVQHVHAVQHVTHVDREQRVHQRHHPHREADVGADPLPRPLMFDQQFHRLAARGGQLQQRRGEFLRTAIFHVQQDLQPALQLAPPQHHQCMANRIDALARAHRRRVHQPQQVQGDQRVVLDDVLDFSAAGVLVQQLQQVQHAHLRRRDLLAAQDHRPREVVALEVFEAQFHAFLELLDRLDLLRQQLLPRILQHLGQRRQGAGLHVLDVDLDDVAQRRELLHVLAVPDHVVQGELEAGRLELAHARQHVGRGLDGFEDFENDLVVRQEADEIAHQADRVDVDKRHLVAHHLPHAQFGRVGDDGGGGFSVVNDVGAIVRAGVAEQ
ncbi:conserved hypothetical protein, partial [Ricinus communis]